MHFVVAYDIVEDHRRDKVMNTLKNECICIPSATHASFALKASAVKANGRRTTYEHGWRKNLTTPRRFPYN